MRVIILAAGFGQRLRPLTNDKPKAMVTYRGRTILQRQIDLFKSFGLTSIVIVGGHGFNALKDTGYKLVKNAEYSKTNMVYSLLCAREYMNDDLIVSYGDIIYEPSILKALLRSNHEISVAVDVNWRSYWEERFDFPLSDAETLKLGENDELLEIGNEPQGYEDIQAQFMGLMKFRKEGVANILALCDKVEKQIDETTFGLNGKTLETAYTTDLLNQLIQENISVGAVEVSGNWIEIDTIEDFENPVTMQRCIKIDEALYLNKQIR